MALQPSGQISMSQVNLEVEKAETSQISMDDAIVRSLFAKPSGQISISDGYSRSYRLAVEYLVIAGGGGSGESINDNGGGGAGGYRSSIAGELSGGNTTAEPSLSLAIETLYNVSIGAGGAINSNGSDTSFHSIVSLGGGRGGSAISSTVVAGNGGSGGGGGDLATLGGLGTAGQGFAGGNYSIDAGGGGGAGGPGGAGGTVGLSRGGIGITSSVTGVAVGRAGGGGGGNDTAGRGTATDGGGAGAIGTALPGTVNTGGGGGGAGGTTGVAAAGGSGIVILRYPASFEITVSAGLTASTTVVGTNKVTQITAGVGQVSWRGV